MAVGFSFSGEAGTADSSASLQDDGFVAGWKAAGRSLLSLLATKGFAACEREQRKGCAYLVNPSKG
jgi:hypothetical protein